MRIKLKIAKIKIRLKLLKIFFDNFDFKKFRYESHFPFFMFYVFS